MDEGDEGDEGKVADEEVRGTREGCLLRISCGVHVRSRVHVRSLRSRFTTPVSAGDVDDSWGDSSLNSKICHVSSGNQSHRRKESHVNVCVQHMKQGAF